MVLEAEDDRSAALQNDFHAWREAALQSAMKAIREAQMAAFWEMEKEEPDLEVVKAPLFCIGVDSDTRILVLVELLESAPPTVFWPIFLEAWHSCDDTWSHRSQVLALLRTNARIAPCTSFLSEAARNWLAGLPDPIPVWRGASAGRVRGLSWTYSREVAEGFMRGHREIIVPAPTLASALVPKNAVFAVMTEREEEEIVLDPRRLRKLRVVEGGFENRGAKGR